MVDRVNEARDEHRKIASLRTGMISGGPSIDDESRELDNAVNELIEGTCRILANNGRISNVKSIVGREIATEDIIQAAEFEQYIKKPAECRFYRINNGN